VRQRMLQEEKQKRKTEQSKKLEQEAHRMAEILNEDFKNLMLELEVSRKITGKPKSKIADVLTADGTILPSDGNDTSQWQEAGQPHGDGHRGENPPGDGDYPRSGPNLVSGESLGSPKQHEKDGNRSRSGLFSIEFEHLTEDFFRSKYEREEHKILINLDHPQVVYALREGGGSMDSPHFLSTVYEVAAVEYAQAVPFERYHQDEQVDAGDALYAVGETIDRITRRFASILLSK
jgi:hypothetical protein